MLLADSIPASATTTMSVTACRSWSWVSSFDTAHHHAGTTKRETFPLPLLRVCGRVGVGMRQGRPGDTGTALTKECPAASYSPTQSPAQYHRR